MSFDNALSVSFALLLGGRPLRVNGLNRSRGSSGRQERFLAQRRAWVA